MDIVYIHIIETNIFVCLQARVPTVSVGGNSNRKHLGLHLHFHSPQLQGQTHVYNPLQHRELKSCSIFHSNVCAQIMLNNEKLQLCSRTYIFQNWDNQFPLPPD